MDWVSEPVKGASTAKQITAEFVSGALTLYTKGKHKVWAPENGSPPTYSSKPLINYDKEIFWVKKNVYANTSGATKAISKSYFLSWDIAHD